MKILRTDPDRFGVRARLLTLLLPGILGLLALDSWNDYRALRGLVQQAYDQALLGSLNALRSSMALSADGSLQLRAPAIVPALFDANGAQHRHLHIGLTARPDLNAGNAPREVTLLGESDLPALPASAFSAGSPAPVWYDSEYRGLPVRIVAIQSLFVDGQGRPFTLLVQASESTAHRDHAQASSSEQALLRDARMVLVVILLVWLGVTWSLAPLERLRKSVLQNKGRNLKRLDTSGVPHEVAPLVDALNQHVDSYRELLDEQSRFLADASHQLRTPLAIMLMQAGVALREKNPEQLRPTLKAMVVQITRTRRLTEQLLSLADTGDNAPGADVACRVDLNAIARDVVLQHLSLAHEKNQDLGWRDGRKEIATPTQPGDSAPDSAPILPGLSEDALLAPVLARAEELHEALANLLHNAIVYTPAGGRITVTVSLQDGAALAEVCDDGPGIAPADRQKVFERFYQADPRPGHRHGAGLGLAIARAYARRNGGDIELSSGSGTSAHGPAHGPAALGLRAVLRLPLAVLPQT